MCQNLFFSVSECSLLDFSMARARRHSLQWRDCHAQTAVEGGRGCWRCHVLWKPQCALASTLLCQAHQVVVPTASRKRRVGWWRESVGSDFSIAAWNHPLSHHSIPQFPQQQHGAKSVIEFLWRSRELIYVKWVLQLCQTHRKSHITHTHTLNTQRKIPSLLLFYWCSINLAPQSSQMLPRHDGDSWPVSALGRAYCPWLSEF